MSTRTMLQKAEQHTYDIVISDYVERKIRHLCNKIYNIEWSGILFYTYEGSIEKDNLKIICQDILPMDIGNSSYTDFNMSPDVIAYMTQYDLLHCECGLIHSHHNMATFFSGTDLDTLEKEGIDRNHFVSLIVNNDGKYTAAVTQKVNIKESGRRELSYNTFEDKEVDLGEASYYRDYSEIRYYMLNVIKEDSDFSFDDVDERLAEIRKVKDSKKKVEVKQKTLFDKYDHLNIEGWNSDYWDDYRYPFKEKSGKSDFEDFGIKSGNDAVDEDMEARLFAARLVTGSISITDPSKIDLDKWSMKIGSIYERIFDDITAFGYWIETFSDILIDLLPRGINHMEVLSKTLEILYSLPANDEYILSMIQTLENYEF